MLGGGGGRPPARVHAVALDELRLGDQLGGHLGPGLLEHGQPLLQPPLVLLQPRHPRHQRLVLQLHQAEVLALGRVGQLLVVLLVYQSVAEFNAELLHSTRKLHLFRDNCTWSGTVTGRRGGLGWRLGHSALT